MTPLLEQEFGGREGAVEFICKNRIVAVRLFPRDHGYTLNPWNIDKLFTLLSDLRMPVLIDEMEHTGGLESYDELYHLCCEYPDVPIVLLTPGYRSARMIYPMMEKCKNFQFSQLADRLPRGRGNRCVLWRGAYSVWYQNALSGTRYLCRTNSLCGHQPGG